jgi:hypothetical protein
VMLVLQMSHCPDPTLSSLYATCFDLSLSPPPGTGGMGVSSNVFRARGWVNKKPSTDRSLNLL